MQSACLVEPGISALGPLEEETTLIGLTFGGYLRSKVRLGILVLNFIELIILTIYSLYVFLRMLITIVLVIISLEKLFCTWVMPINWILCFTDKMHEVPRQV